LDKRSWLFALCCLGECDNKLLKIRGVKRMETIRIYNLKQVAGYMYAGVNPISVEKDGSTGKILFVFKKEDTAEVWEKWKAGTLV
jgi:hypothetical protein